MFLQGNYEETITPYDGTDWPRGTYTYFARWTPENGRPISGFSRIGPDDIAQQGLEMQIAKARQSMYERFLAHRSPPGCPQCRQA